MDATPPRTALHPVIFRLLRIARSVAFVAGTVLLSFAVQAGAAILVFVFIGVRAYNAGNQDTASLAKLAVIVLGAIASHLLLFGGLAMILALLLHVLVRRYARRIGWACGFPVITAATTPLTSANPTHPISGIPLPPAPSPPATDHPHAPQSTVESSRW
jgi:hypothetical protein